MAANNQSEPSEPGKRPENADSSVGGNSPLGRSFRDLTGESIEEMLDLASWEPANRLAERFDQIKKEIDAAAESEVRARETIRKHLFPLLAKRADAPMQAGVHRISLTALRDIQQRLLFSGLVQAADGASVVHKTLPITIVQTAVVLANYLGETGSWGHRVYQRDVRMGSSGGLEQALALLQGRAEQEDEENATISDMLRRGLMMHGELNVLATRATSPWRVGHGHPLPKELLTGTGMPELIELSVPLFRKLLLEHQQFVYVPTGTNDKVLQTIGSALVPLEYAIVQDVSAYLAKVISDGHYGSGRFRKAKLMLDEFQADSEHNIVAGVYRVSPHSPAQVFYAHADRASEAALVAMADAILVETRGSPMLLDIAGTLCRDLFPPEALLRPISAAYAQHESAKID